MRVEHLSDPAQFAPATEAFLLANEAENNLILGLFTQLAKGRREGKGEPVLYLVRDDNGSIAGVALWAGYQLMQWGVGSVAAIIGGLMVGGIVFGIGHTILASSRSGPLRVAIVVAFVMPAVFAGYGAGLDLSAMGFTSGFWQHAFAVLGGFAVGGTTLTRLQAPLQVEAVAT